MQVTTGAKRGCGYRQAGGIYAATPLGPRGHMVECFLCDLPRPVEAAVLGLSPRGVTLFADQDGTTHILDIIGEDSYPFVADFVEETRALGLSRRLPRTTDFSALTPASRLFTVHRRALIANPQDYYAAGIAEAMHDCPAYTSYLHCSRGGRPHAASVADDAEPCARLWWHDLDGDKESAGQPIARRVGDTVYQAHARPAGVVGQYELAIFGAFPIRQLEIVRDREGDTHETALDVAARSTLPCELVEE